MALAIKELQGWFLRQSDAAEVRSCLALYIVVPLWLGTGCSLDARNVGIFASAGSVSSPEADGAGGSVSNLSVEEGDTPAASTTPIDEQQGIGLDAGAPMLPIVGEGVVFRLARRGDGFGQIRLILPDGEMQPCDNGCEAVVTAGSLVVVTAMPEPYSLVRGWSEPGCAAVMTCEVGVDQARTVEVQIDLGYNVAFVTSQMYRVNELPRAGEPANRECARLAAAAGLHGTRWVAWLAADGATTDPGDDIVPFQFFQSSGGWVRPDGVPFVTSLSALEAGAVLHPMNVTEQRVVTSNSAWSAARLDGTLRRINNVAIDCANWTSVDPTQDGSMSSWRGVGNRWTGESIRGCSTTAALHCFGDDPAMELSIVPATGRLAFLSSSTFTPSGGIFVADELCQRDACEAGLTGSSDCNASLGVQRIFRSYLHTQAQPAWERFDLTGPTWVRPDGIAWLMTAADLANDASARRTGLNVTALSQYIVNGDFTWLGSPGGEETCSDWTSETGMGRIISFNDASVGSTLSEIGSADFACDESARLFCLQD